MKTCWRQVRINVGQTLLSARAFVLFICALLMHALPVYIEVSNSPYMFSNILYYFYTFLGNLFVIHIVISAILIATSFPDDWNYGISKFAAVRSDRRKYAMAKATGAWLSVFLFMLISTAVFLLLLMVAGRTVAVHDEAMDGTGILNLVPGTIGDLADTSVAGFYAVSIVLFSLKAAFWGMIAFYISVINANVFLTVASPLIVYYCVINFLPALGVPYILHPADVGANLFRLGSAAQSILYSVGYFLVLALIFACFSCRHIIRRFNHD